MPWAPSSFLLLDSEGCQIIVLVCSCMFLIEVLMTRLNRRTCSSSPSDSPSTPLLFPNRTDWPTDSGLSPGSRTRGRGRTPGRGLLLLVGVLPETAGHQSCSPRVTSYSCSACSLTESGGSLKTCPHCGGLGCRHLGPMAAHFTFNNDHSNHSLFLWL